MFSFLQILYLLLFAKIIIVIMTCYYSNYHYGLLFRGSFFLLYKISFQYRGCFQNTVKQLKLSVLRKQFKCLFRSQSKIYDRTFCDSNYRLRAVSAAYAIYPRNVQPRCPLQMKIVQMHIQNPVKNLRWSFFAIIITD